MLQILGKAFKTSCIYFICLYTCANKISIMPMYLKFIPRCNIYYISTKTYVHFSYEKDVARVIKVREWALALSFDDRFYRSAYCLTNHDQRKTH